MEVSGVPARFRLPSSEALSEVRAGRSARAQPLALRHAFRLVPVKTKAASLGKKGKNTSGSVFVSVSLGLKYNHCNDAILPTITQVYSYDFVFLLIFIILYFIFIIINSFLLSDLDYHNNGALRIDSCSSFSEAHLLSCADEADPLLLFCYTGPRGGPPPPVCWWCSRVLRQSCIDVSGLWLSV